MNDNDRILERAWKSFAQNNLAAVPDLRSIYFAGALMMFHLTVAHPDDIHGVTEELTQFMDEMGIPRETEGEAHAHDA